jgi:hypothetical protein
MVRGKNFPPRQNKIGKVYSSEYMKIPICVQTTSQWVTSACCFIDNSAERDCGLSSLLLERNNKCNNGMKGKNGNQVSIVIMRSVLSQK